MSGESRVRDTYDAVADLYADFYPSTDPEEPEELAAIDRFVARLPTSPLVLDAGCGAGRMLPHLAARGVRVEGVDLSPEMVRRARADHPGFPVEVTSVTDLPQEDGRFDGVFAWYSLIHIGDDDLPAALAELVRVLRSGGHLLLAFQTGAGSREAGEDFRKSG